jgi:hypothetical protein
VISGGLGSQAGAGPGGSSGAPEPVRDAQAAADRQGAQPGWRIERDPETGELLDAPSAPDPASSAGSGAGSETPLVERDSDVPGGGVLVDLEGRADSSARVVRKGSGAHVECLGAGTH